MHLNEGTHDGIAAVFENIERQAGLSVPGEKAFQPGQTMDMSEYCILTHLDLGSIEKGKGIQQSRVIEKNVRRWIQYPIAMPGLLHVAMANTKTLEWIYLKPKESHLITDSVYTHVGCLQPCQAGHFVMTKGPGHRRMHHFTHADVIVCVLNCWTEQVKKMESAFKDLKAFSDSLPSWSQIVTLLENIVLENVAGPGFHATT